MTRRCLACLLVVGLVAAMGCGDEGTAAGSGRWEEAAEPPLNPREGSLGVWTGEEALIIGGSDAPPCPANADCDLPDVPALQDGAAFDPESGSWRAIADAPVRIDSAQGVAIDELTYVWQADSGRVGSEDAFLAFDGDRDRWMRLPMPPVANGGFYLLRAAADRLVLARGSDEGGESPDLIFDPATSSWGELPQDPLPPSYDRSLTWSGEELVLIAKERADVDKAGPSFAKAAALDLQDGEWRPLPVSPSLDMGLTQCWIGTDGMILNPSASGGRSGGGFFSDGGILVARPGKWLSLPKPADVSGRDRYVGGALNHEQAAGDDCASDRGLFLDAKKLQWVRVKPRDEETPSGQVSMTVGGRVFTFGGAVSQYEGGPSELTNEAWIWSPAN